MSKGRKATISSGPKNLSISYGKQNSFIMISKHYDKRTISLYFIKGGGEASALLVQVEKGAEVKAKRMRLQEENAKVVRLLLALLEEHTQHGRQGQHVHQSALDDHLIRIKIWSIESIFDSCNGERTL